LRTLLVDRKKEIGTPVQCGEVIGATLLKQAGIRLPPQAVMGRQSFTRFIAERELVFDNSEPYWRSITVERKMLDKLLAAKAAEAGAIVRCGTRLTALEDGVATLQHCGSELKLKPKAIVAADGVHSTIGRLLGVPPPQSVARGVEFELVARKTLPPCMQIFIEGFIGLGYGWIIPKGRRRANVGIGTVGRKLEPEDLMAWVCENLVTRSYFGEPAVLEVKIGDAPVAGYGGAMVKDNVVFCGDAAGQTLAFVGEGIMPAHICGMAAGRSAARIARGEADGYEQEMEAGLADELRLGGDLRDAIASIWEDGDVEGKDRSFLSALLMNELLPETPESQTAEAWAALARSLAKDCGRRLEVRRLR
jgi:digeranylgeranylglycerophospholipid reductase